MSNDNRILLVDDEPNVLAALKRQLRKRFAVSTATSGQDALDLVASEPSFRVMVCDMRMPGMAGLEVLKQMQTLSPDTTRMMLTGNADQQTAIDAVNEGNVFRFFTKPCPTEKLVAGIEAGIRQYQLVTAEQELLERTLAGSVKVLVDILSLSDPTAFGQANRVRNWMQQFVQHMKLPHPWEFELAATLSTIGQVSVPMEIMDRHRAGKKLTEVEADIVSHVPETARNLIDNIPRLTPVAEAVYFQAKGYDGSGFPVNKISGAKIPLGARVLRILNDLVTYSDAPMPTKEALDKLKADIRLYDPDLVAEAHTCFLGIQGSEGEIKQQILELPSSMLFVGDTLVSDLEVDNGSLYLAAGYTITQAHLEHIHNLTKIAKFKEPIKVSRSTHD